jgi:adenylosuccinate lyase
MARLLRGYAVVGLENVALWHERDISHSSAERVVFPDACIALDYMLHTLIRVLDGMDARPDRMQKNLNLTHGVLASEAVLHALIEKDWTRERAYQHVQNAAKLALGESVAFSDALSRDPDIAAVLDSNRIKELTKIEPRYDMAELILKRTGILDVSEEAG